MREIFYQAIHNNYWISQIYRYALSKPVKKLIMCSWTEMINTNTIHLHLRTNFQYLYSKQLHYLIQKEFSNNFGISIKLYITKHDDFSKKTPIEYIYSLYVARILKLKQECYMDPNIKLMQFFFDVEFDERDITIF